MKTQPVRWWVVAGAIIAGWALACFGPTAAEGQTISVSADSAVLRQMSEFRLSNDYDTMMCIAAHWETNTLVLDSVLGPPLKKPPCPDGTRALVGNADPELPRDLIVSIGRQILAAFPIYGACGITGTEPQEIPDGRVLVAPVMTCAFRKQGP